LAKAGIRPFVCNFSAICEEVQERTAEYRISNNECRSENFREPTSSFDIPCSTFNIRIEIWLRHIAASGIRNTVGERSVFEPSPCQAETGQGVFVCVTLAMEPAYVSLYRNGELARRAEAAVSVMASCVLCPRRCGVNRLQGELGYCKTGRRAKIASYNAHFGEESPLVGRHGSGTIFVSNCNLLCSFCQNYEISHLGEGTEVEPEQLAAVMLALAETGCHNINFVTPSHVVPQILEGLLVAAGLGLSVPLVYNSGGYDLADTLKRLDGVFDIYMPDFKFWDNEAAARFCDAPDYRDVAEEALREMHRQVGDLVVDREGIAVKGLLVRHLVMPNGLAGTEGVMSFLAGEISPDTYVNVMDQYRPCGSAPKDETINRRLTSKEYQGAVASAKRAGLRRLDRRERFRLVFGV
jgi:putative pyruvate formate lyase activating enzyme